MRPETDLDSLYRIVSDPQYNAIRMCLRPDPVQTGMGPQFGASVDDETRKKRSAELGRDSE